MTKIAPSLTHFSEKPLPRLLEIMHFLRDQKGCAWDRQQTLASLRPYLLEECHEVLEILDQLSSQKNVGKTQLHSKHKEELGDLLLQVVFQCEIQKENKNFDFNDVAQAIGDKLIRRHPHLFDPNYSGKNPPSWEEIKEIERRNNTPKSSENHTPQVASALDGVPNTLPALIRAYRTGEKAHDFGFDWPDSLGVFEKMQEELEEVRVELELQVKNADNQQKLSAEIGDLLYATVNLARHHKIDPEAALRGTMSRFEQRFRMVENFAQMEYGALQGLSLEQLDQYWERAKKEIKNNEKS